MKKLITIISIITAIATILAMAIPVSAATSQQVDTSGTVGQGGSNNAPFVCAKFETPDDSAAQGTQVLPTPPNAREMRFYAIVGDPNGTDDISSVDIEVWYPSASVWNGAKAGTLKFDAQAQKINGTWVAQNAATRVILKSGINGDLIDMNADSPANTADDLSIKAALQTLYAQGRLTLGVDGYGTQQVLGDDNTGVIHSAMQDKQLTLKITALMDKCQPSLGYIVKVRVTDKEGNSNVLTPLTNTFTYLSIVGLVLDFNTINWGTLNVNQENTKLGDNDMSTPNYPTVQNIGNDRAMISVNATPLTGAVLGKQIKNFDAKMTQLNGSDVYGTLPILHGYTQFNAGVTAVIATAPGTGDDLVPVILPPCTTAQVDFSVFPAEGTPGDTYSGHMTITISEYSSPVNNLPVYVVMPTN